MEGLGGSEAIAELLERRGRATARHDAALERFRPRKDDPRFRREVMAVVEELERVLAGMKEASAAPLELSRTARWLADAYSDLAREERVAWGEDLAYLARAAATYQVSERLLARVDAPRDRAILDFNYANTLRRFDVGNESLLEAARKRYEAALRWFEQNDPARAPQVRSALESLLVLLQVAPLQKQLSARQEDLERLRGALAQGRDIEAPLRQVMEGGGPPALVSRALGLVSSLPASVSKGEDAAKLQSLVAGLRQLSSAPSEGELGSATELLGGLEARLRREVEGGKLEPARQASIRAALDRLSEVALQTRDDIPTLTGDVAGLRTGAQLFLEATKEPSYGLPLPPAGSRAAVARERFWDARRGLFESVLQPGKGERECHIGYDLARRVTEIDRALVEAGGDDARAIRVERELARPRILELRRYASRLRPCLADPIWPGSASVPDANAVFFSGERRMEEALARRCARLGLEVLRAPHDVNLGDARWRQLTRAGVCVFDLGLHPGMEQAAVAYELGIAQALGKSVLVISHEGVPLPFDLDVPTVAAAGEVDAELVAAAVHAASYWIPAQGTRSSIEATVREVRGRFGNHPDGTVVQSVKALEQSAADPVAADEALRAVLAMARAQKPMVIHPLWTAAYPRPGEPRLFHVMPFGPEWAAQAMATVEATCGEMGCVYERGDRVSTPEIIESIWHSICTATHVLVDLTGFNANVAFELGLAHVLGRPTLLVGQAATGKELLFPAIAKLRAAIYRRDDERTLAEPVRSWLAAG